MFVQDKKPLSEAFSHRCILLSVLGVLCITVTACKVEEDVSVTFTPDAGVYTNAQTLAVRLPKTATNVYLTTDTLDPVPNSACAYSGENLPLDRATLVKLRYDVQGNTYRHERLYVIDENAEDSRLINRKVIEAWENFFVKQVFRQMPETGDQDATHTLTDAEGGTVTRTTRILDRSIFFDIPTAGSQTYTFNFFEKTDPDTGELVMLNSGSVYGYLDEDGGYYSTTLAEGKRLKYAGTYNGWADGDFTLDAEGKTSAGHYTVFCQDYGCASTPVIYALGSAKQLIEVSPIPNPNTRRCTSD